MKWGFFFLLFFLLVTMQWSLWRIFSTLHIRPALSLIPFYNLFLLHRNLGKPDRQAWQFLFPLWNLYYLHKLEVLLARRFGKSPGWARLYLSTLFFIGYPYLACRSCQRDKPGELP